MTIIFWILAALLAAAALALLLPALLSRGRNVAGAQRDATNVAVYRDQLKELDTDLGAGTLSRGQYDEARRELERRMLDDVRATGASTQAAKSGRGVAVTVGIAVPLVAALLYFMVGNPSALAPGKAGDSHGITLQQVEGMVERLAARMKENPDDVKGWEMLGRSYAMLERFPEAVAAYANAVKHSPPDAQLLADYADALAMWQGRRFQGEPERLIEQALKIDPNNVKALALAGTAAFERKDFRHAISLWEKILEVMPPDTEMADAVRSSIADARALAGGVKTAPAPKAPATQAAVSGTVSLAPGFVAKAAPDDTVFVFARPAEGPRMPLAVMRKRVRDLPAAFKLDDSMAMSPAARLSNHQKVIVGARVSKSGNPAPQPGDLEGLSAPVGVGHAGVVVVIDREISSSK